jgi:hypothetical protein
MANRHAWPGRKYDLLPLIASFLQPPLLDRSFMLSHDITEAAPVLKDLP